jgi:hypothetical protein
VFPMLSTRPNWTITRVSADPLWNPGGCASVPTTLVNDRWLVMEQPLNGLPGDYGDEFVFGLFVYDRVKNSYSTLTPVLEGESPDWLYAKPAGSDSVQVVIGTGYQGDGYKPRVTRIINLGTMSFTDRLVSDADLPLSNDQFNQSMAAAKNNNRWAISQSDGVASGSTSNPVTYVDTTLTSKVSGKSVTLSKAGNVALTPLTGDDVFVAYANLALQPSKIADQAAIWSLRSNDWDRVFDTQAPKTAPREVPYNNGLVGFSLWIGPTPA